MDDDMAGTIFQYRRQICVPYYTDRNLLGILENFFRSKFYYLEVCEISGNFSEIC
jgi:hypothetical protein